MNPAVASLLALIVAIVLSIVSRLNVGLVAVALAWLVGVYVAGLGADTVISGFPAQLFLTLAGVTLLFAAAEANGTLERVAHRAFRLARGNARLLPPVFFVIAFAVSTVGPGAISSVALVAPLAMGIGGRVGVPHFLTALMVANGANAGNLSPVSSVGVIANAKIAEAGLGAHPGKVWFANLLASALVAFGAYLYFTRQLPRASVSTLEPAEPLSARQRVTAAVVVAWIAGVLLLKLNVGLSAFAAVTLLIGFGFTDQTTAIKRAPWGVILMVCGVTVLIGMLEKTGGLDLFTRILSRLATPNTVNGVIAFVTGIISTYSSTSGVVLPAFLPTAPGLAAQVGGADSLAIALSINVGSALVDVSPLSTLGALCLAQVSDDAEAAQLFRNLLIWGLAMALVGAVLCQLLAGPLARL